MALIALAAFGVILTVVGVGLIDPAFGLIIAGVAIAYTAHLIAEERQ